MVSVETTASEEASWTSPGAGITGGYNGKSESFRIFIVFFLGLGMYNACEIILTTLFYFKHYRGLYFWSLLIAAWGIIPYALGFLIKFLNIVTGKGNLVAAVIVNIGWYPMITGQAVVLWSRLHLVVSGKRGDKVLHWTKCMIIMNVLILHMPTTIMAFGAQGTLHTQTFAYGYNIIEKVQMVGFFLQETILSSIYVAETVHLLRTPLHSGERKQRKILRQLIAINLVIISMDLVLLGVEAASLYILQILLKCVVYSLKLKLEFAILSKLVSIVPKATGTLTFITNKDNMDIAINEIVDFTKIKTDITHASIECSSIRKDSALDLEIARFEHDVEAAWHGTAVPNVQCPVLKGGHLVEKVRELDSPSN